MYTVVIDGDPYIVTLEADHYELPMLKCCGFEWYIAENSTIAGEKAREYWEELAHNDPEELTCIIGTDTLVAWALGQSAGPGTTAVNSLEEWLDLHLDVPEEHFATYDSCEYVLKISDELQQELGWDTKSDCVAYRSH